MNIITEIIGNKKYAGSINSDLKSRVILEESNKVIYENTLFDNISQSDQFRTEKNTSNIFRVYGTINPIMSVDVYQKTVPNDIKVNVYLNYIDLNLDNWSIVVLKSKPTVTQNASGSNFNMKGVKHINKKTTNGTTRFYLDLTNGLPAKTYYDNSNQNNSALYFPAGHNFSVGDKIKITSKNGAAIPTGVYTVTSTDYDRIYINYKGRSFSILGTNTSTTQTNTSVVSLNSITQTSTKIQSAADDEKKYVVKNLKFDNDNTADLLSQTRPPIFPFFDPEYYVAKVIEKEQLEYYVKVLEVIDVIDELDDCGFSTNNFNEKFKNYFLNRDLDISNYKNHLNEPLSEIYVGIIKNGSLDATITSNVESHFSNYIEFVSEGDGIEEITSIKSPGQKVKKGDTFFHSICEYSTEQLTETEITHFKHRFIHKNVLFYYNPFYYKQLKIRSSYIESGDNVYNLPSNAIYSRKDQKYIWRELFDIGVADENGNLLDYPFMNGGFYLYNNINFFLNSEKNATRKYALNINDINSLDGSQFTNDITDILNNDTKDPFKIKPFYQYTDKKC